ncbi:hypothetical protein ACFQJ5_16635 [Halomicroarcula sp. GCM10025324]|uniref:hypothetical protein n=1 Tax=Halomicroarcula sp. GCM10025324 TaxID=3252667 RepID=UPI00360BE17D
MNLNNLLSTLMVVLVVLAGVPGGVASAQTNSGPAGMASIPNENVAVDVPEGETPAIPAEALRGEVYASSNASTMRVTVTTPDRAEAIVGSNGNIIGAGDLALVFGDDEHHAGREVAIPASEVNDALGYTPEEVRGTHSSGSVWTRDVAYENGYLVFEVPEFSQNSITFTAEVTIDATPATDGFQSAYEVGDTDAVANYTIQATGVENTEIDTESAAGLADGETLPLSIAGNLAPTGPASGDPQITWTGEETTTSWSATATGVGTGHTQSVTVPGNVDPQNESVTFTGREQTTPQTVSSSAVSSGGTVSYTVDGNVPASSVSVNFTGTTPATTADSSTGTGSGSVSVGGNIDPTGESVSITGRESTTSETTTATLGPGGSFATGIDGNLEPTGPSNNNPTLTLTNNDGGVTDHTSRSGNYVFVGEDGSEPRYGEARVVPDRSGELVEIKPYVSDVEGGGLDGRNVEIRIEQDGIDQNYGDGTLVYDGPWPTGTGRKTITLDNSYSVSAGNNYVLDFTTTNDGDGTEEWIYLGVNNNYGGNWIKAENVGLGVGESKPDIDMRIQATANSVDVSHTSGTENIGTINYGDTVTREIDLSDSDSSISSDHTGASLDATLDYTERTGTEDPSIDVDGDGTDEASWSGVFGAGQTTTPKSADGLSTGSNSVSTSTTAGPAPDWTIDYTERTGTEDPSIDLDGDGSTDVSHSGILLSGESHVASASNLSTGSYTADVSTTAHTTDVEIGFTERTATEDPGVDLDGDGTIEARHTGILRSGETATVTATGLPVGSTTLETDAAGGIVDYTVSADGTYHTEDPAVDVDGDGVTEAGYSGILSPGQTATAALPSVSRSTTDVELAVASGSVTTAEVTYTERTETEDVTVYVNDNSTDYFGRLGDGNTTSLATDSAWVREGTNNVTLTLSEQSADAPATQVNLSYSHEIQDKQTVTYTAEQLTSRYVVNRTYAENTDAATVTIPFERSVYEVRDLEQRTDGGAWQDVDPADYTLENTTLTVELGSVSSGSKVSVRSNGSLARVNNGSIKVVQPSVRSGTLDSRVKLTDWAQDSYLRMPEGAERVHYAYDEPWPGEENEYAVVHANGSQQLHLATNEAGSEFQLSTVPVTAEPVTGEVRLSVSDGPDMSEPTVEVAPGDSIGDEVAFTFVDAKDDQKYVLYSTSNDVVRDSGTANSPLTLSDDDSDETLQFQEENQTASTSGGSNSLMSRVPMGPVSAPEEGIPVPLIVGVLLLIALAVLVRRFEFLSLPSSVPTGTLPIAAAALVVFYIADWASGHAITRSLGMGLQQIAPLAGLIGIFLLAYYLYKTYIKGQGPRPIQIVSSGADRVQNGASRLRGGNN